jgi:hypothetical protein
MTDRQTPTPDPFGTGRYEIRLAGHLDARWNSWFDGLTVIPASDGTTVIRGPVADQAALHGLLQRIRDLGLPLVSVSRIDDQAAARTAQPSDTTDRRSTS